MAGAVIIVVVLLVLPILMIMGCVAIAAILGETLRRARERDNAGSELVDLNR